MGAWSGKMFVYDVQKNFKLVKYFRCKSAVRSLCLLNQETLVIGENEGWFEVLKLGNELD